MHKLIACVSLLAVMACAQPAEEEPDAVPDQTSVEEVTPMAVDGGPLAGSYTTTGADGTEAIWTLMEDGTFTLEAEGADPVTGTYTNTGTETGATFCADPEGDEAGEMCFEISTPGEDSAWTATDPEGNVMQVARNE